MWCTRPDLNGRPADSKSYYQFREILTNLYPADALDRFRQPPKSEILSLAELQSGTETAILCSLCRAHPAFFSGHLMAWICLWCWAKEVYRC